MRTARELAAGCGVSHLSTRGIDSMQGGFQERLTLSGEPTDDARRARVQPRQIYAFSRAPSLGGKGDASGAVAQGFELFPHPVSAS